MATERRFLCTVDSETMFQYLSTVNSVYLVTNVKAEVLLCLHQCGNTVSGAKSGSPMLKQRNIPIAPKSCFQFQKIKVNIGISRKQKPELQASTFQLIPFPAIYLFTIKNPIYKKVYLFVNGIFASNCLYYITIFSICNTNKQYFYSSICQIITNFILQKCTLCLQKSTPFCKRKPACFSVRWRR